MFYINYLSMHKVHKYACWCIKAVIVWLCVRTGDNPPVHTHKPYNNLHISYSILQNNQQFREKHGTFPRMDIPSMFLFVCLFVALRPKSTAMVIAGRSVHLTTLFSWASLNKQLTSNRAHTFACN